jgi:CTP:molybdopterin cytidylyltransferase MocA
MGCLYKQGGGLYPRLRIGAVLLAAGEGRRMGGVAKPLISLRGKAVNDASIAAAAGLAMSICNPASDQCGDAEYRTAMAGEMTQRALRWLRWLEFWQHCAAVARGLSKPSRFSGARPRRPAKTAAYPIRAARRGG